MAIGPNGLDKFAQKIAQQIEDHFDAQMERQFELSDGHRVIVYPPANVSATPEVIKELKHRYREAGWKDMIWHKEQKDGDWIELIR